MVIRAFFRPTGGEVQAMIHCPLTSRSYKHMSLCQYQMSDTNHNCLYQCCTRMLDSIQYITCAPVKDKYSPLVASAPNNPVILPKSNLLWDLYAGGISNKCSDRLPSIKVIHCKTVCCIINDEHALFQVYRCRSTTGI